MKTSGYKNVTGARIRRARMLHEPRMSQRQLARCVTKRRVKLDQGAISRIEGRSRHVLDTELVAIARSLKVPVGLLCGESQNATEGLVA